MADSSMSKLKLGPQESEENGKCNYVNLVTLQGGFLYIVWPSVLSLNNLRLHKTKAVKNICMHAYVYKKQVLLLIVDFLCWVSFN